MNETLQPDPRDETKLEDRNDWDRINTDIDICKHEWPYQYKFYLQLRCIGAVPSSCHRSAVVGTLANTDHRR